MNILKLCYGTTLATTPQYHTQKLQTMKAVFDASAALKSPVQHILYPSGFFPHMQADKECVHCANKKGEISNLQQSIVTGSCCITSASDNVGAWNRQRVSCMG